MVRINTLVLLSLFISSGSGFNIRVATSRVASCSRYSNLSSLHMTDDIPDDYISSLSAKSFDSWVKDGGNEGSVTMSNNYLDSINNKSILRRIFKINRSSSKDVGIIQLLLYLLISNMINCTCAAWGWFLFSKKVCLNDTSLPSLDHISHFPILI